MGEARTGLAAEPCVCMRVCAGSCLPAGCSEERVPAWCIRVGTAAPCWVLSRSWWHTPVVSMQQLPMPPQLLPPVLAGGAAPYIRLGTSGSGHAPGAGVQFAGGQAGPSCPHTAPSVPGTEP